jgi:hypothetical protein
MDGRLWLIALSVEKVDLQIEFRTAVVHEFCRNNADGAARIGRPSRITDMSRAF